MHPCLGVEYLHKVFWPISLLISVGSPLLEDVVLDEVFVSRFTDLQHHKWPYL